MKIIVLYFKNLNLFVLSIIYFNAVFFLLKKSEKESPAIGKCGYSKSTSGITTKHDTRASNRRNACRIMEFPPGFATGDGGGFDMQLSNNVSVVLCLFCF